MKMNSLGSADAILALVNAGANVEADDKDGLTGMYRRYIQLSFKETQSYTFLSVSICLNKFCEKQNVIKWYEKNSLGWK